MSHARRHTAGARLDLGRNEPGQTHSQAPNRPLMSQTARPAT